LLPGIILATQEIEIRRIMVRSQPGEIVRETLSRKNPSHTHTHTHTHTHKRVDGMVVGVGPEFKPQ
jgi:hypothetical protein